MRRAVEKRNGNIFLLNDISSGHVKELLLYHKDTRHVSVVMLGLHWNGFSSCSPDEVNHSIIAKSVHY
jgi:hypothetical protein